MLANALPSVLGLAVQAAVYLAVYGLARSSRSRSLSVVFGGVAAIYGYALVLALAMLMSVPWWTFNALAAALLLASLLSERVRNFFADALTDVAGLARDHVWAIVPVMVTLLLAVSVAGLEADLSIDGQLYHGPVLAEIYHTGTLWGWTPPNQYTYYTDLTMAGGVNLAGIASDARFDNAIQIPHMLLLVGVIVWALRRTLPSALARTAVAIAFVTAPVVWLQARILYVDLAYGAALAAGILLVCGISRLRRLDVLVIGTAAAAVIATKPAGLVAGLLVAGVLVVRLLIGGKQAEPWRSRFVAVALLCLPLVTSLSFYARNYIRFSNPVYPVAAQYGPLKFPGIIDMNVFASGERGNGFVDPGRVVTFVKTIGRGMIEGVVKADYDPRWGGFGRMPWVVLALIVVALAVQSYLRWRGRVAHSRPDGLASLFGMAGLSLVVLAAQPATFDTRYVIAPTAVLMVCAVTLLPRPVPQVVVAFGTVAALLMTAYQVQWVERHAYAGLNTVLTVMDGPEEWRPNSPASLSGPDGPAVAWLPDECVTIALETAGGVSAGGMTEKSLIATLPYGLYGPHLCNEVLPVTVDAQDDGLELAAADYLVVYADHESLWREELGDAGVCFAEVQRLEGSDAYPQDVVVLHQDCR